MSFHPLALQVTSCNHRCPKRDNIHIWLSHISWQPRSNVLSLAAIGEPQSKALQHSRPWHESNEHETTKTWRGGRRWHFVLLKMGCTALRGMTCWCDVIAAWRTKRPRQWTLFCEQLCAALTCPDAAHAMTTSTGTENSCSQCHPILCAPKLLHIKLPKIFGR